MAIVPIELNKKCRLESRRVSPLLWGSHHYNSMIKLSVDRIQPRDSTFRRSPATEPLNAVYSGLRCFNWGDASDDLTPLTVDTYNITHVIILFIIVEELIKNVYRMHPNNLDGINLREIPWYVVCWVATLSDAASWLPGRISECWSSETSFVAPHYLLLARPWSVSSRRTRHVLGRVHLAVMGHLCSLLHRPKYPSLHSQRAPA